MRKWLGAALAAIAVLLASLGAAPALGAASGVTITVLSTFPVGQAPSSAAATNTGDVVVPAAVGRVVSVSPTGKQKVFGVALPLGEFGIGAIGMAYDNHHQLYAAVPQGAPGLPGIYKISANGNQATPVPGSEGMVAADGMGLDSATGYVYATDIFGGAIWRVTPGGGSAELWTSHATNPLIVEPDGVKVLGNTVYVSDSGRILTIPLNPDGSAGTATVWATPGGFTDDMVIDPRTGDVYVTRLDNDTLLQITPDGTTTVIASNADGLLGAANMTLIDEDHRTIIYLANGGQPFFSTNTTGFGPALLKITIS